MPLTRKQKTALFNTYMTCFVVAEVVAAVAAVCACVFFR